VVVVLVAPMLLEVMMGEQVVAVVAVYILLVQYLWVVQ
jgi:hypothetical protein